VDQSYSYIAEKELGRGKMTAQFFKLPEHGLYGASQYADGDFSVRNLVYVIALSPNGF
jgi:hypothetical protein